jgi:hypothetical protein
VVSPARQRAVAILGSDHGLQVLQTPLVSGVSIEPKSPATVERSTSTTTHDASASRLSSWTVRTKVRAYGYHNGAPLRPPVNPRLPGPAKVGPGGALEHFQLTEKFAFLLAPQRRICGF